MARVLLRCDAADKLFDDRSLLADTESHAHEVERAEESLAAARLEQARHAFVLEVGAAANALSLTGMANAWLEETQRTPVIPVVRWAVEECLRRCKTRIGHIFHPADTRVEAWRLSAGWKDLLEAHVAQEFDAFKDDVLKLQPDLAASDATFVTTHRHLFAPRAVRDAESRLALQKRKR